MKFSLTRKSLLAVSLVVAASLSAGIAFADSGKEGKKGPGHHGMFERMDANGDGKITKDEARKMSEARFQKLDGNGDGAVTSEEAKAAHEKMRAEWAKKAGKDGEGKSKHHKKGQRHGPGHLFAKLDVNKDGKITKAEAQKVSDQRFERIDTNKDGVVTREEAIAAHKAHKKEMREKREARGEKKSA